MSGVCDFCSRPNPTWSFPAHDFAVIALGARGRGVIGRSLGGAWHACEDCRKLVEAGDRERLADHCLRHIGRPASFRPHLRAVQDAFFIVRAGPPEPLV